MTTRTAQCACGRFNMTLEGEPLHVLTCHCDFCQRRTGSVFQVSATFSRDQLIETSGETKRFNGVEVNNVPGHAGVPAGYNYHFCTTCGSTVYWDYSTTREITGDFTPSGKQFVSVAVGNFADPDFPVPRLETFAKGRHNWVLPVPGADQFDTYPSDPSNRVGET
jgi:hypothetical protein